MSRYLNVLKYLEYLTMELDLSIAIKDFVGFIAKDPDIAGQLNPYFIHKSSFCMFIKSHPDLWTRCQESSQLLFKKCGRSEEYFSGSCYCGYSEIVIPVKYEGKVIAAICVGGFELDAARSAYRLQKIERQHPADSSNLQRHFRESVGRIIANPGNVAVMGGILADFLRIYYQSLVNAGSINPHTVYVGDASRLNILSNAIEFIRLNYENDIRMADIAAFCQCSESYISHIFKKSMNQNLSHFINQVRIDKAREYISTTGECLYAISNRCGFSDPNYFSYVFKQITGLAPSSYRKNIQGKKTQV